MRMSHAKPCLTKGCGTAKSLVAAGLCKRVLVQLSYAIGVAEPLSVFVDSYGTGTRTDAELVDVIANNWDLRPGVIGEPDFEVVTVHC